MNTDCLAKNNSKFESNIYDLSRKKWDTSTDKVGKSEDR